MRLTEIAAADTPDQEVLRLAVGRSLVLLSNDKDFSDILRYPPPSHAGIVDLRMRVRRMKHRCIAQCSTCSRTILQSLSTVR
jgi:Domain of unknown function (DUF5615)